VPVPDLTIPPLNQSADDASPIHLVSHTAPTIIAENRHDLSAERAERAFLCGETIPNKDGGSRILVDVAPLSNAGRAVVFHGSLSLLILSSNDSDQPHILARWDYTHEQALAAQEESPDRFAMRFRLQVPNDLPVDLPVELWVRLVQDDGSKVLAKAPLTPNVAASFASAPFESTGLGKLAGDGQAAEVHPIVIRSTPTDDGWAIAKPGETVVAMPGPPENADGWRVATQPLPEVTSSPVARSEPPVDVATEMIAKQPPAKERPASTRPPLVLPNWSAERDGSNGPERKSAARSASRFDVSAPQPWSPTR
jgi:hypothetical protein